MTLVLGAAASSAEGRAQPVPTPPPAPTHSASPPAPAPTHSASPPAPPREPPPVEVVITGTRLPENARRSPVRVDIVTRAEAERRGATNVGDALAFSLGTQVNPSAYASLGQPSAVQMGGLDRDRVLILEDGERVVGDVGGAIDLAQLPIAGVARIETLQGPASALYGTSALGGVVNVISAPPELEGWSGAARTEYRAPLGAVAMGQVAYRAADTWAQLESSFTRAAGIALDPALPDLSLPETTRGSVGLRAGTSLSSRLHVTARARFAREREDGLQTQEVPGLGRYITELPATTDRLNLRLRQTLSLDGGHELSLSLAKQWFWSASVSDRRDSPVDALRARQHTMHSIEATTSLFPGHMLSALVGARFEAESFSQSLRRTEVAGAKLVTTDLAEVPHTSLSTGAVYGQLRLAVAQDWTLLGGARVEVSPRYGVVAAPRLGVAFAPNDWLVLRANAGRGYRAPSAKELGFAFDHSVYGYRVIGNPDLAPESSWGVSGDVELTPVRRLRVRASVQCNWLADMIDLQLAPGAPGGPAGVDTYQYRNVGSARTSTASISAAFRATSALRAEVGWAFTFTRDDTTERPLPGRPPHTVTAGVTASLPFAMEAVLRARLVTDAYLDDDLRTPAFLTVDARLQKSIGRHLRLYTGTLNLLGAQKDPHRTGDSRPIEGRQFYLGASADFPWEHADDSTN
ncbi:MAG: TonB-dependent receptor [Polyangiaceae bacterium]